MNQFSITEAAANRIAELQGAENAPYFRVRVDGGGCSGFQYVFVDDMSLGFLEGAQLDYVEELLGSYFKLENPNATASCGCGTSFSI